MRRTLTNVGVTLAVLGCAVIAAVVGWELGRPARKAAPPDDIAGLDERAGGDGGEDARADE